MDSKNLTTEDRIMFAQIGQSSLNILARASDSQLSQGSGFVIDLENGIIGTNKHVVIDDDGSMMYNFRLQFNGIEKDIASKISYISDKYDLALLQFNPQDLGDEIEKIQGVILDSVKPRLTERVYVVGNSLGLGPREQKKDERLGLPRRENSQSAAIGVVTHNNVKHNSDSEESPEFSLKNNEFVKCKGLLYPGNSGSAVMNDIGYVVGVVTIGYRYDTYEDIRKHHQLVNKEGKNIPVEVILEDGTICGERQQIQPGLFYRPTILELSMQFIPTRYLIETLEAAKQSGIEINYKTEEMLKRTDPKKETLIRKDKFKTPEERMIEDEIALQKQKDAKERYEFQTEELGIKPPVKIMDVNEIRTTYKKMQDKINKK